MAHRRPHRELTAPSEDARTLLSRARRLSERGEHRRAMLTLKQACDAESDVARLWTIYGVYCARAGRRDDSMRALKQALWLRQRANDAPRAEATRMLLERLELGEAPLAAA